MPQAVSSLPSLAYSIGPVTRRLPLRSSKALSSSRSGGFTSAVALANFRLVFSLGFVERRGIHLEFRERASAVDRSPRPAVRQIRIVQQLQPHGRDLRQFRVGREFARHAMSARSLRRESSHRPAA